MTVLLHPSGPGTLGSANQMAMKIPYSSLSVVPEGNFVVVVVGAGDPLAPFVVAQSLEAAHPWKEAQT